MNGVDIVGNLLRSDPGVTAIVTPASIKAGALPDDVQLPALLVRSVSLNDRQRLKRAPLTRSVERVSVAVRAASYAQQTAIIKLIRARCAGWTGASMAGASNISVLTAGLSPDLRGPGGTFEQTQDFRVSFDA